MAAYLQSRAVTVANIPVTCVVKRTFQYHLRLEMRHMRQRRSFSVSASVHTFHHYQKDWPRRGALRCWELQLSSFGVEFHGKETLEDRIKSCIHEDLLTLTHKRTHP